MKIFISAVSDEFGPFRQVIASDLRVNLKAEVMLQEDFRQHGRTLLEKLESYIATCDRLISLVGDAYGSEPDAGALPPGTPRRSYTQWEYFFAQGGRLDGSRQHAKDTFVYFASQEFRQKNQVAQAADVAELQQTFVEQIRTSNKDRWEFDSLDKLRTLLLLDHFRVTELSPIQQTTQGYARRIQNFLDEYIGTPAETVPFGGRNTELEELDKWLTDSTVPPYALLVAEAGRGKSALLVRWTRSLIERDLARVIFVPFSLRFNTALSAVAFPVLAGALSEIYGEAMPGTDLSADEWRSVCLSYLSRRPPDGRTLLVVLDGIDEAADWPTKTDLFPVSPPSELRALVSARLLTGDVDEHGWLRRLEWDSPSRARPMLLAPLTRQGVSDVLAAMSDPLRRLATRVDVVGELFRLSQGDPLVVHLYVKALLPNAEGTAALQPGDLPSIQTGLDGYFERWLDEQARHARYQGRTALSGNEDVRSFLNICATAFGPLSRDDVAEIAGGSLSDGLRLREIAAEVDRFVIGDGQARGYVFSHSRLGQFFWDRMTRTDQAKWKGRFLDYGRETLQALVKRQMAPKKVSAYVIQYYGVHLEQAAASPGELYALVAEAWLRAWEARGTYAGFLNDTDRAWRQADSAAPPVAGEVVSIQIKCALCRSSVAALSANVPAELPVLCVQHGVLNAAQALVIASRTPDEQRRSEALSALAPILPTSLIPEAVEVARSIGQNHDRAMALIALSSCMGDEAKCEVIQDALAAVRATEYETDRAKALRAVSPHLPETLNPPAMTLAKSIEGAEERATVLIALAPGTLDESKDSLILQALEAVRAIPYESTRATALIALAPHVPEALNPPALAVAGELTDLEERALTLAKLASSIQGPMKVTAEQRALEAARAIDSAGARASALASLVPHLSDGWKPQIVQEALAIVQTLDENVTRASVLTDLAPDLPESQKLQALKEALEAARLIRDSERRPMALARLAPYLPTELHAEALAAARGDAWARAGVLRSLAPKLSDELLMDALEAARGIREDRWRAEVLSALAPWLPEPLKSETVRQVLISARAIHDERDRSDTLIALAPHVSEDLLPEILSAAQTRWPNITAQTLIGLAQHLPAGMKAEATRQALSAARVIQDGVNKVHALVALAPYLPSTGPMLLEVLEAARTTGANEERVDALADLVPYLPEPLKSKVLTEALAMARAITKPGLFVSPRAEAIATLAPRLTGTIIVDALEVARAMEDERDRALALTVLARQVPDESRAEVSRQALEAARAVGTDQGRAFALIDIVGDLPEAERAAVAEEAVDAARKSTYAVTLASVVEHVAEYVSDDLLSRLLRTTVPTLTGELTTEVLNSLAPRLSGAVLQQAQAVAQRVKDDDYRAAALAALAPCLPPETDGLRKALDSVLGIRSEWLRATALSDLAWHLPEDLKERAISAALAAVRTIRDKRLQPDALRAVAPHLPEWARAHPASAFAGWSEILRALSALPRQTFLPQLQMLLPFALALVRKAEEQNAAVGISQAVQDVTAWWP